MSFSDLGTCLRYLNLNPTKKQLSRIQEEFGQDFITFEMFEPVVMKILITNTYDDELLIRDSEDIILRAFEVLDPEKTGYIETDKMVHLLKEYGEPFDLEEIREFIHVAEDPENHVIRYEELARILANE